jgi:hypothetical protein
MDESSPTPPSTQRFTLNAPPPVRPLAIAAGTVVVGAVLLVLRQALELPVAVAVLAGLLVVLGVALVLAGLLLTARLRTEVTLYPNAIHVRRRGEERSVSWRDVTEVSLTHPRLSLLTEDRSGGLVVVNPRQASDPVFADLVDQVRRRLDADRGYSDGPTG